jgi:hypothetical protein
LSLRSDLKLYRLFEEDYLAILAQPMGINPSPKAEEWIASLVELPNWNSQKIEDFKLLRI